MPGRCRCCHCHLVQEERPAWLRAPGQREPRATKTCQPWSGALEGEESVDGEKRAGRRVGLRSYLFIYCSFAAFFFFFLRKLQFGVKMYFTVVKSMNFPLPATHLAEVGGLERQQDGRAGGGAVPAFGAWTTLPLPLDASLTAPSALADTDGIANSLPLSSSCFMITFIPFLCSQQQRVFPVFQFESRLSA